MIIFRYSLLVLSLITLECFHWAESAAQEKNGTIKIVEFSRATSKGNFIGCQLLYKLITQDHVHRAGNIIGLTVNFSSYYFPDKPNNFKLKVCGYDLVESQLVKFDIPYAYLITTSQNWAKYESNYFESDNCFNSLFWSDAAAKISLEALGSVEGMKLVFSRKGSNLDVEIPFTVDEATLGKQIAASVDILGCMSELTKKYLD